MNFEAFHFFEPLWLWGILVVPVIWLAYSILFHVSHSSKRLETMIDSHLLPYLLRNPTKNQISRWKRGLIAWSMVWIFLMLALAGPRLSYRDIEMRVKDQSLVILLDLSESMLATDVKPSRLVRAKQKIEDFLQLAQGVKFGLIAFAADPHMITPLTDDKETIRHLLPSLDTDLVYIQGSRLHPALKMASRMLESEPGVQKAIVIISDGGFEDRSAIAEVKKMADLGIAVHTIGVGSVEGSILQDSKGNIVKKNGKAVHSKLERGFLQEISKVGGGFYIEPRYSNYDESVILDRLQTNAETIAAGKTMRLWDESFYLFLLPILPFFIFWFRRGMIYPILAFAFLSPSFHLQAHVLQSYFLNAEQKATEKYAEGSYDDAAQMFQDPYRKGIAYYKAEKFADAEAMFKQSVREEVACEAGYNLGNACAKQKKFQEAIKAYEDVLKKWPEHKLSQDNLEIVKKMLNQQKQKQDKNSNDNQDSSQNEEAEQKNDNQSKNSDSKKQDSQKNSADQESMKDQEDENLSDNSESKKDPSDQETTKDQGSDEKQKSDSQIDEDEKQALKDENSEADEEVANEPKDRSQQDLDADMWLNRLNSDQKKFLKNKFYIETKNCGTREGIDSW